MYARIARDGNGPTQRDLELDFSSKPYDKMLNAVARNRLSLGFCAQIFCEKLKLLQTREYEVKCNINQDI